MKNKMNKSLFKEYLERVQYDEDLFSFTKNLINNTSNLHYSSSYIAKKLSSIFSPNSLSILTGELFDNKGHIKIVLSDLTSIDFNYFPDSSKNFMKILHPKLGVIKYYTNSLKKFKDDIIDEIEESRRLIKRKYRIIL